ncbi:TPA: DUF4038 domain-containing protein [Salmonella enterica subsp. salamae]|nr:DUF4038 domain-containing protein [Salmonella enterica subsp. salamae]
MLSVCIDKRHFLKDGEHFFYLADTVWSIFTNASMEDWIHYLEHRQKQGFNALQINILPQWDRSKKEHVVHPFYLDESSYYDVSRINNAYFENAQLMLDEAYRRGFEVALVLIWCSFVPGSWADGLQRTCLLRKEDIVSYVKVVHQWFSHVSPLYIISGDTGFESDDIIDYYDIALTNIKRLSPESLTTLHIRGRLSEIPDRLKNHKDLDFWFYQSGHNAQYQDMAYSLAQTFYNDYPKKPIINSEPCYEMMGYSRGLYGRFSRSEVRKAAWQSVLSGANAGITYGAHGLWSWHTRDSVYGTTMGEGFLPPYTWDEALKFPGAADYVWLKNMFTRHNLWFLVPYYGLHHCHEQIRAARQGELILVYVPYNIEINIECDNTFNRVTVIELESKRQTESEMTRIGELASIPMTSFTGDCLYVLHNGSFTL